MSVGPRRRGRELALSVLFQMDVNPMEPAEGFERVRLAFPDQIRPSAPALRFAEELVAGVAEHRESLDAAIRAASHHWRLERMGRVDRSILRLAAFELLHGPETPARVVLNEAVELAKRYGAEDSRAFVNGVLDNLARRREPDPTGDPAA